MDSVNKNIKILEGLKGIANVHLLADSDKKDISDLEDKHNLGVFEAVNRDVTIVCTHNSSFRQPPSSITVKINDKTIFPLGSL